VPLCKEREVNRQRGCHLVLGLAILGTGKALRNRNLLIKGREGGPPDSR